MKNLSFFLPGIFLTLIFLAPIHGQETFDFVLPGPERPSLAPENPEQIPGQFRELFLGMGLEELKQALLEDDIFAFRGDRDVSFLPVQQETIIETTGRSFIRRAFFQLHEENVYIMSFSLNARLIDHYSVYTSLVRRYGEPISLNPHEAVWESDETRLSLERPLTVKYLDRTVFNDLLDESRTRESQGIILREEFLRGF